MNDSLAQFFRSDQNGTLFRILICLLYNELKYPFVSLSASTIKLLLITIFLNSLRASVVKSIW